MSYLSTVLEKMENSLGNTFWRARYTAPDLISLPDTWGVVWLSYIWESISAVLLFPLWCGAMSDFSVTAAFYVRCTRTSVNSWMPFSTAEWCVCVYVCVCVSLGSSLIRDIDCRALGVALHSVFTKRGAHVTIKQRLNTVEWQLLWTAC